MARTVQVARYTADGTQVERTFRSMGEAGERMADRVKRGAQSMHPALRALDTAAKEARTGMEGAARHAGSFGNVLSSMGPIGLAAAAGLGAAVLAFNALGTAARGAVRDVGSIADAAQTLGTSTDFVQEFRYAVLATGGDIAQADSALTSLSRSLGQLNTEVGQRARGALVSLGFSEDEIRNMGSVEEALPRIIARIGELDSAAAQMAIAQKLGLDSVLETVQAGEAGFARLRAEAERAGYVLDRELIERADEMHEEWTVAAAVLDLQVKAALVELAPIFLELAQSIAGAARELRTLLDLFRETDSVARRTAQVRAETYIRQANLLRERWGDEVVVGGDPSRVPNPRSWQALIGLGGPAVPQNLQQARDRYARYMQEFNEAARRLVTLDTPITAPPGGGGGGNGGSAAANAQANAIQQLVERLREETRVREELLLVRERFPKMSADEAQSYLALEDQLRALEDARQRGLISSDEELANLQRLAIANHDAAQAARENAAALVERNRLSQEWLRVSQDLETPFERMRREEGDFRKRFGEFEGTEAFARGIERIREEFDKLAEAQHRASLEGQTLAAIWEGQIRSLEDFGRFLMEFLADSVIQELIAGGVRGEGGIVGFGQRVLGRIGDSVRGGPSLGGGGDVLAESAEKAAGVLSEELTPTVVDAGAKMALSTLATVKESSSKTVASLATGQLTIAMKLATAAAREFAAAAGAEKGGDIAKALFSSFGKGGGKWSGGSIWPGMSYDVAERGTEILLLSQKGAQVLPHESYRGLEVLMSIAARAERAPAPAAAAGAITVNLRNESGIDVEHNAAAAIGPDGQAVIDITLTRKVASDMAAGKFDNVMQRYNARPPIKRRG